MPAPVSVRIRVSDGDQVSALVTRSEGRDRVRGVVILGHGAGGDMTDASLVAVHDAIVAMGLAVVRFRFLYREQGRKAPDTAPRLEAVYRAVVGWVRSAEGLDCDRIVLGGQSMGGRIASLLAATGEGIEGLLFLGYPLHPAGKPEKLRDVHLYVIGRPMLFIQGDRDPLCDLKLLAPVLKRLGDRATLHVIDDGDHSFKVRKRSGRTVEEARAEVAATAKAWLGGVI
jgi:predicted alpha/beta-hydrolase family hydrolase